MVLGFWEGLGRNPSRARSFTKTHRLSAYFGRQGQARTHISASRWECRFHNPSGGGPRRIRLSIFSGEFLFVYRLSNHQVIPASTYDDTFFASFFRSEPEVRVDSWRGRFPEIGNVQAVAWFPFPRAHSWNRKRQWLYSYLS
jgi:hypothetical protein